MHEGGSTSSGHYYAYVRPTASGSGGRPARWFCMNDSSVRATSESEVRVVRVNPNPNPKP